MKIVNVARILAAIPTVKTHAAILTQAGVAILMIIANVKTVLIIEMPSYTSDRIINVALLLMLAAIHTADTHAAILKTAGATSLMLIANVTVVSIIGD